MKLEILTTNSRKKGGLFINYLPNGQISFSKGVVNGFSLSNETYFKAGKDANNVYLIISEPDNSSQRLNVSQMGIAILNSSNWNECLGLTKGRYFVEKIEDEDGMYLKLIKE